MIQYQKHFRIHVATVPILKMMKEMIIIIIITSILNKSDEATAVSSTILYFLGTDQNTFCVVRYS